MVLKEAHVAIQLIWVLSYQISQQVWYHQCCRISHFPVPGQRSVVPADVWAHLDISHVTSQDLRLKSYFISSQ